MCRVPVLLQSLESVHQDTKGTRCTSRRQCSCCTCSWSIEAAYTRFPTLQFLRGGCCNWPPHSRPGLGCLRGWSCFSSRWSAPAEPHHASLCLQGLVCLTFQLLLSSGSQPCPHFSGLEFCLVRTSPIIGRGSVPRRFSAQIRRLLLLAKKPWLLGRALHCVVYSPVIYLICFLIRIF